MREKFPKENQPPPRGYSGPRPVRFAVKRHKKIETRSQAKCSITQKHESRQAAAAPENVIPLYVGVRPLSQTRTRPGQEVRNVETNFPNGSVFISVGRSFFFFC